MENQINLEPLAERLHVADLSSRSVLHGETDRFLRLLRKLRAVFRQCGC